MGVPGVGNVAKSFAVSTLILSLGSGLRRQKTITVLVVGPKSDFLRRTTVVAAITATVRNVFRRTREE